VACVKVWPALLLAPLAALGANHLGYALSAAACVRGEEGWLHAAMLAAFVFCLITALLARQELRRRARHETLALVAMWSGMFFTVVVAAMWATRLFVDPCMH
jgi:hypothetical protein